jgi:hypothetical protein
VLMTNGRRPGGQRDPTDAAVGRMMASAPLTIRIDLDPEPGRGSGPAPGSGRLLQGAHARD